ncbi:MAG: hypothetical protein HUU09_09710 [Candidatus Jettenia caeni]|nr:hypothetical protein [Candidatus Jettenia caeni]GIL20049.1 MAG: hypothetical protein BroJett041_11630 [Candidatus Jettenia caeni]GJQ45943.1 MAG: hypothetical protein JETCAE04_16970 [Candidatus Jettenia caeni]
MDYSVINRKIKKNISVSSEAVDIEIINIPDAEKRQKVGMLSSISQS